MEINIYQNAIEQLVKEGYTILQVITKENEHLYFAVFKWQEGYFNSAQSIDFNTVEGVNITSFLNRMAAQYANITDFIAQFTKTMENGVLVRCEFTKDSEWFKWSPSSGTKKY